MVDMDAHFKMGLIQENFQNLFCKISNSIIKKQNTVYNASGIQHPLFNAILNTHETSDNLPNFLNEITDFYKKQNLPFAWWVTKLSQPKNLELFLIDAGFTCVQSFSGRVLELEKYQPTHDNPAAAVPNLSIQPVQNIEELDAWLVPMQISFEFSEEVSKTFLQNIKKIFENSKDELQHFMAFLNGKHVASASLFLDKNSAGLYNLGVLPEYRKRGIGTALKHHRLQIAKQNAYENVVIQSAPMGEDIDQKLGFTEYMRLSAYTKFDGKLQLKTISD